MLLSENDKSNILLQFPNIKLSYENIIHKKVYSDYFVAIPEGDKYFAWFTVHNNTNVCYFMKLSSNKQIIDIKIINCCFDSKLCYETIVYGTVLIN